MKLTLVLPLLLATHFALAHNHEETKKTVGHDKEHTHVKKSEMDHEHDDYHHEKHNHKEHHPEHDDSKNSKKKK